MEISEKLNQDLDYKQLREVMEKAHSDVSFWGGRKILFLGYEGSVSIDFLARLTTKLLKNNWEFNVEERKDGKFIAKRITDFYQETDQKIQNRNFITRFFNWLCGDNGNTLYTTRWFWEDSDHISFEYYTAAQWNQAFPGVTLPEEPHLMCTGQPARYYPKFLFP